MFLHNDREKFIKVVADTSKAYKIRPSLIEKDYFVTMFLKYLAKREPLLVFKGGTCLSKCFKVIKRFSEDIDINLFGMEGLSHRRKKEMKTNIKDTINDLGLGLLNPGEVFSGRDYNLYKVSYPRQFKDVSLKQHLEVESYFLIGSFPTVNMGVTSLVYDWLKESGSHGIITEYDLEPFEVRAQALERTFADKIFAVCDYYMGGRINGQSRHLYDLHKILPLMTLNDGMKDFIEEIRRAREGKRDCPSAEKGVSLPETIRTIMAEGAYKEDYDRITAPLLYETVAYGDIAATMGTIADWLE